MKTTAVAVTTALLFFLAGNAWVLIRADLFTGYFYEARMVALAHVFTLGWVSLMIIGVLRQLGPIAFGLQLRHPSLLGASVAIWIPAVLTMVAGFATSAFPVAGAGAVLVFVAVTLSVGVFSAAFKGVRREPAHGFLMAALHYFAAAAILGVWMGLAKGFDVALPSSFHRMLFAHIHLAGIGWAGTMILAVLSRLFPQPHLRYPRQARIRLVAYHAGLTGLAVGLISGGDWYPVCGAILAMSLVWYAAAFLPVIWEFSLGGDRSTLFLTASWISLVAVAVLGFWLAIRPGPPTTQSIQLQFVYGFVFMFGWLTLMILGMLYRIIPTHVSKLLTARGVDARGIRKSFVDGDLQLAVLALLLAGLVVSSSGIFLESVRAFRAGWILWLLGIAGFLSSIVRLGIDIRRSLRHCESPK